MNEPRYFDNSTACQSQTGTCTNAMQVMGALESCQGF